MGSLNCEIHLGEEKKRLYCIANKKFYKLVNNFVLPLKPRRRTRHKIPLETLINSRSAINTDGPETIFKTTISHD